LPCSVNVEQRKRRVAERREHIVSTPDCSVAVSAVDGPPSSVFDHLGWKPWLRCCSSCSAAAKRSVRSQRHRRLLACSGLLSRPAQLKDGAMKMSWILVAVLTFLLALVALSYIVEALRPVPKRPDILVWAPRIPIHYVDLGGIRASRPGWARTSCSCTLSEPSSTYSRKSFRDSNSTSPSMPLTIPGTAGRISRTPHTRLRISTSGQRRISTSSISGERQSSASRSAERSRSCWRRRCHRNLGTVRAHILGYRECVGVQRVGDCRSTECTLRRPDRCWHRPGVAGSCVFNPNNRCPALARYPRADFLAAAAAKAS